MSHQPQLQTQPNSSSAKSDKIDSASDMKESLQKSSDSSDHSAKRTSDRTVDSAGSRDSTSSSSRRKSRSSNSRYQDAQLQIAHKNPKQVWPLIQIFCFFFCEKSLICLESKLITPNWGNTFLFRSYQQLPCLHLGPLRCFLSWHGALQGPSTHLERCFRNYRDTRTPSGVPR